MIPDRVRIRMTVWLAILAAALLGGEPLNHKTIIAVGLITTWFIGRPNGSEED